MLSYFLWVSGEEFPDGRENTVPPWKFSLGGRIPYGCNVSIFQLERFHVQVGTGHRQAKDDKGESATLQILLIFLY